jgi:GAF domain-containing protein
VPKERHVQTIDYELLKRQVRGLLEDERDLIANAANFAAFVYAEIPAINWAGFYLPVPDGLVLGPFGGKPACSRLPKGQGVCNRAFDEKRTVVVDDVSQAADHIYCDSASKSEMVVPLMVKGQARGVFDLDSPELARFRAEDQTGIEGLVAAFLEATSI